MTDRQTSSKTGRESGHESRARLSLAGVTMQRTLNGPVQCSGVGLHGGAAAPMTLLPAPAHHGIVFRRRDLQGPDATIPALWSAVFETGHRTVFGSRAV